MLWISYTFIPCPMFAQAQQEKIAKLTEALQVAPRTSIRREPSLVEGALNAPIGKS